MNFLACCAAGSQHPFCKPRGIAFSEGPHSGFTLVELMVTIAIVAILVSIAGPAFQAMVLNNRMTGLTDGLVIALNYARSSALRANVPTLVCPVGTPASTTCGTNWSTGWMVVSNPGGPSTLLQTSNAPVGAPVLSAMAANGNPLSGITFDTRGLAGTAANFKICDSRGGAYARSIQTLATGFVQSGPGPGKAAWGGVLACP